MLVFNTVTKEQLDEIQTDAGVLLRNFDPDEPNIVPADVICATTGGVNPSCVPSFVDYGEDIDNVPNNTMEMKRIDYYDCLFAFTSLNVSETFIKLSLGAAKKVGNAIVPQTELKNDDFSDIWWVGNKVGGGFVAIHLKNALSDGGFSLQTTKKNKGQVACTLRGHTSLTDQSVPMEFYSTSSDTAS